MFFNDENVVFCLSLLLILLPFVGCWLYIIEKWCCEYRNTFCKKEKSRRVEQNIDIIPTLPQFKYRPNDAVDFCIWNYINYARDLEGKPLVEYQDVYKFYDKMKQAYIEATGDAWGIFKEDPTEYNRDKIKKFIKLPEDYYEDGGEE